MKIYLLGIVPFLSCVLHAQIKCESTQSFKDRILNVGIVNNEGYPDTVYVFDPEEKKIDVAHPPGSEELVNKKVKAKPAYIKWRKGEKRLKPEETVIGIGNNRILIRTIEKTRSRLASYELKGTQFHILTAVTFENIDYSDRIIPLYSPAGDLYAVHHRNAFVPGENRSLEMFDVNLNKILNYDYRYDTWVNFYFANNDTLCVYEADGKKHKINLLIFSIQQNQVVMEKEISTSWDFRGLPYVSCLITKEGYIVAANSDDTRQTHITAFRNNGDTIWNRDIEWLLGHAYYLPLTHEVQFFCSVNNDARGGYQLILDARDGNTKQQLYYQETFLKSFVETKANSSQLRYVFSNSVTLADGNAIAVPIYCYTLNEDPQGIMLLLINNGLKQEVIELPLKDVPDYKIYPTASNKFIVVAIRTLIVYHFSK